MSDWKPIRTAPAVREEKAMSDKPCFFECAEEVTGGEMRYAVVRWDTRRGSVAHRQGMPETIAYFPHTDLGRILAEEHCRKMEAQK